AVDDAHGASGRVEVGLEYQRPVAVSALDPPHGATRREQPPAMVGGAEERCKASGGIEARSAQPVDRSIAPDQGGRAVVADHRVVFDPHRFFFRADPLSFRRRTDWTMLAGADSKAGCSSHSYGTPRNRLQQNRQSADGSGVAAEHNGLRQGRSKPTGRLPQVDRTI